MKENKKTLELIRELSDRLVKAQHPIRILDAVKWDDNIKQSFFAHNCQQLPAVDREYYANKKLDFDADQKLSELLDVDVDAKRQLGEDNPVGKIICRMALEYADAVRMIKARGTKDFSRWSRDLYGSAHDVFYQGEPTMAEFGDMIAIDLSTIAKSNQLLVDQKNIAASDAVQILQERLNVSFPHPTNSLAVKMSDGIVSDASAGSDFIKLKSDAKFSDRDLRLLEAHEGWVHVGTTMNGLAQPYCTFLSKGPPSSTITQEGLAIFVENLSFRSHPDRVLRVSNRVRAVAMAEDGANFLEVYKFYTEQGISSDDSYANTVRVFRGSTPDGQPFTKDISYVKGFVLIYNYVQLAIKRGFLDRIPLLFCGKATLRDLKTLSQLVDEGIITPPAMLPPQIADLHGLTAWMCYSGFLRQLNLKSIEKDYAEIL